MLGMAILLGFNSAGLLVKDLLQLPLPANVIGLVLFTAALYARLIKLEWVEDAAQLLNRHMMLFFIPFLVGTLSYFHFIVSHLVSMVVSLFLSTFVVLAVTGWITKILAKSADKEGHRHDA